SRGPAVAARTMAASRVRAAVRVWEAAPQRVQAGPAATPIPAEPEDRAAIWIPEAIRVRAARPAMRMLTARRELEAIRVPTPRQARPGNRMTAQRVQPAAERATGARRATRANRMQAAPVA